MTKITITSKYLKLDMVALKYFALLIFFNNSQTFDKQPIEIAINEID